jgi:hypothetical protein
MKDTENMNEYRNLENGEIIKSGDLVGKIEGWDRVWYKVGEGLIGEPCEPEWWVKRLKD